MAEITPRRFEASSEIVEPQSARSFAPSPDDVFEGYPEMLKVEDVAAILRVSKKTVQRQYRAGVMPAVKIGRYWFLSKTKLAEFIAGHSANTCE